MGENSSENVAELSGMIQLAKANFQISISALPEQHQANFFNEAVARVVLQKVAEIATRGGKGQDALIKLTLTMLYGQEMLKPTDWIDLGVFLDEATARLVSIRTRIVDWLREGGGAFIRRDLRVYENLGCFIAGLYTALQKLGACQLAEDLRVAGRFGMRLIADTVRVDKANYIESSMRETLFLVAFDWLANSDGFFVLELVRLDNPQEIRYWHERFCNFLHTWQWQDIDYGIKISREVGRFTEVLST